MRYYKFFVGLILSFGLEKLQIDVSESRSEEIEPILAAGNMQNLRWLVMQETPEYPEGARLLGNWRMPLLKYLKANFIPGTALGKSLVQCKLDCSLGRIGEVQIDAVKEFLAAAKSLQDLRLFLPDGTHPFYEVCDLLSLRSLEADFEPHPSLARHLI